MTAAPAALSATLMLRSARAALGYWETPHEHGRLALLANRIGRGLYDPPTMAVSAGATQEVPGSYAYRVPIGFGSDLMSQDWARCGFQKSGMKVGYDRSNHGR